MRDLKVFELSLLRSKSRRKRFSKHLTSLIKTSHNLISVLTAVSANKPEHNEFQAVKAVLSTPSRAFIYIVGLVALGIHLSHGIRSALQTLGINHKRWNLILKVICLVAAWSISAGFISLVIWAIGGKS